MRPLIALVAAGATGAAAAHAAPLPCAPTNTPVRWVVARGAATACFPTDDGAAEVCYRIAPGAAPKHVATPAPVTSPSANVRAKLGPRAAAEVARVQKAGSGEVTVTGDGEVLVIEEGGSRAAWRIDRDRKLDLQPPRTRSAGSDFALMSIQIAAGVMVATWEDCAGPCGLSTIVDSRGKNVGGWFGAGHAVTLDAKRLAIVPTDEGARFLVLDAATGRRLAAADLGGFEMQVPAVIDDRTLVALWRGEGWEFHIISVAGARVRIGPPVRVPGCQE